MVLGLGSLKKSTKNIAVKEQPKDNKKKYSASNEAADILKKMDEKAASGDCPFC